MITEPTAIRMLYTAALAGKIDLLPRLSTLIRRERGDGPALLFDLGQSCTPAAWICSATSGRGMLVAMDALGYDAFHIGPLDMLYTQPALVQQIQEVIATPLAAGPWSARFSRRGVTFMAVNALSLPKLLAATGPNYPFEGADVVVGLSYSAGDGPTIVAEGENPRIVRLSLTPGGEDNPIIGRVDMALLPDPPYIHIEAEARLALTPDLNPDPSILSVIEFVQSEASQAERKRGGK